MPSLDRLRVGQRACIQSLSGADNLLQRLLEMGLLVVAGVVLVPDLDLGCVPRAGGQHSREGHQDERANKVSA